MFACLIVGNKALKFEVEFSPTPRQWCRRGSGLSQGFQSSWWNHAQAIQRDLRLSSDRI